MIERIRHTINSIPQYERERAALLERCSILDPTFIYAPSNADFAPEVRAYIQAQLDAALGPRLQTFVAQVAGLMAESQLDVSAP